MTREEAINKVREMNLPKETKEILEALAPELAESEDERIRKELINFLRSPFIKENLTDEMVAPWLAYLKKQKECVADSSKTSADEDESIRKFLVDYFTSYKIGNVATKINGVKINDILAYLERQKEPNSEDLLEWAKKKFNEVEIAMETGADDPALWGQRNAFKQAIDKLNSM